MWARLTFLGVDHDGQLWRLHRHRDWARLGALCDDPEVPRRLEGERAELLDIWLDAARYDERAEWADTHRRQSGCFAPV